jgi:hypothetical protein
MNDARPAVQLCCAYASVNNAPSVAMRSMLGVLYPIRPRLYALTLSTPTSSPQMTRMFGFLLSAPHPGDHRTTAIRMAAAFAAGIATRWVVITRILMLLARKKGRQGRPSVRTFGLIG